MRYARDPLSKVCRGCGKRFVGYDPDHCPACGGFGHGPANDRGVPPVEMRLAEAIARTGSIDWISEEPIVSYWVDQDAYDRSQQVQRNRRRRP